TNKLTTVETIAPSIVVSNMMMIFGHHATIGIPPTTSGQRVSVNSANRNPATSPNAPPPAAIQKIQVCLYRWLNSYSSYGCDVTTVIEPSGTPSRRSSFTARCAAPGSEYKP